VSNTVASHTYLFRAGLENLVAVRNKNWGLAWLRCQRCQKCRQEEYGDGFPPLSQVWSLGEHRELPQQVRGRAPAENRFGSFYNYQKVTKGNNFADITLQLYSIKRKNKQALIR